MKGRDYFIFDVFTLCLYPRLFLLSLSQNHSMLTQLADIPGEGRKFGLRKGDVALLELETSPSLLCVRGFAGLPCRRQDNAPSTSGTLMSKNLALILGGARAQG